jgi:cell division protein FtsN
VDINNQTGKTVLGFVIGVVVGLAAALGVAVYVTKVPVPFVNKGQTRSADQDAIEAKKNKNWDPNAPLYGKSPAKPAAQGAVGPAAGASAAGGSTETAAPAGASPSVAMPAAKTEVKAENKPAVTADPLGDLARAKSSASGVDPFTYFVQAGAYRTPEDAESQRAKLSLSGVEAKVTEREQSGRPIYRVRIGPFENKDEADRIKERLDSNGIDTALVRIQR